MKTRIFPKLKLSGAPLQDVIFICYLPPSSSSSEKAPSSTKPPVTPINTLFAHCNKQDPLLLYMIPVATWGLGRICHMNSHMQVSHIYNIL